MVVPRTRRDASVAWATNMLYPTRVHMTNARGRVSLCGFPVTTVTVHRPGDLRVCPDCALLTAPCDVRRDVFALRRCRAADPRRSWLLSLAAVPCAVCSCQAAPGQRPSAAGWRDPSRAG